MARAYPQTVTVHIEAPEDVRVIVDRCLAMRAAILRALRGCGYCYRGECRAEAHVWLREAAGITDAEIRARTEEGD